jgi:DNA polymerase III subunit gamma/tau
MFDNIIGQKPVVSALSNAIRNGDLASAMLFFGPLYAGKLSTALELGRVLTCEEKTADWQCMCSSCRRHRLLLHSDVLLMGSRDFMAEIAASADVLFRVGKQSSRFLFIRACRKLLRRFDAVLWEGDEAKVRQHIQTVAEVEAELDSLAREGEENRAKPSEKAIKKIVEQCSKLAGSVGSENIPIHQVRKAISWAHIRAGGSAKLIIIENADKMLESSRNSLLKLLEEPPPHVTIVLLTTRKGAIIRTILSRLRSYSFLPRTDLEGKEILKRIFQEEGSDFPTLRDYFLAWKNANPSLLKTLSLKFIELLFADRNSEPDIQAELDELFSARQDKGIVITFAEELLSRFEEMVLAPGATRERISLVGEWTDLLRESVSSIETLNLSPKNVLQSVFYRMRSAV